MRLAVFVLLALSAGPALAQDACSFTFNQVSRRVESRCTGTLRDAPLGLNERLLLSGRTARVCVVRLERLEGNRLQFSKPECK